MKLATQQFPNNQELVGSAGVFSDSNEATGAITLNNTKQNGVVCDVAHLPRDMRRMLKLQFKEFIHTFEDSELVSRTAKRQTASNRISVSVRRACAAA